MYRCAVVLAALCCVVSSAVGQSETKIIQHNRAYQDPNEPAFPNKYYYEVYAVQKAVVIHHGLDGEPFEFEAILADTDDPNDPYRGPGDINSIVADRDAGPVAIKVVRPGALESPGAANVGTIDLSARGVSGSIARLLISGNLTDPNDPSTTVLAGAVSGAITVVGDITQDVQVGVLLADLSCYHLGNLTVTGPQPPDWPGPNIRVGWDYTWPHVIDINAGLYSLWIDGEISGSIHVSQSVQSVWLDEMSGSLVIDGNLTDLVFGSWWTGTGTIGGNLLHVSIPYMGLVDWGSLEVMGDLGGGSSYTALEGTDIGGTLTVHGNLLGDVDLSYLSETGRLEIDQDARGLIKIGSWSGVEGTLAVGLDMEQGVIVYGDLDGNIDVGQNLLAPSPGSGLIVYGDLNGSVYVTGDLEGDVHASHLNGTVQARSMGSSWRMILYNFAGTVTTTENMSAWTPITQNLSGTLHAGSAIDNYVGILGDLSGDVSAGGDISAPIHVWGDVSGTLSAGPEHDLSGPVEIGGNFTGALEAGYAITDSVEIAGDFGGRIHTGTDLAATVSVGGGMGSSAVVDVDGSVTGALTF